MPQEIPSSRNPCMNLIQGVCPLPRSECPYYHGVIDPPYPDIILGKSKSGGMSILESSTLQRIIERITDPHNTDIVIRNAFLLTYHSYTTTNEILEILEKRSNVAYEYSQLFPSNSNTIANTQLNTINTTSTNTPSISINPTNQITPCSTPTSHIIHYDYSPNPSSKSLESSSTTVASSSLPIVSVFPTRESFLSFDTDTSMTRGETEFFNDLNDTVSNSVQIRVLSLLLAWIRTPYSEDDFRDEDCRDQLSNFLLQLSDNVSSIRPNVTYVIDRFITLCNNCGYKIPSILLDYNNRPEIKSDKVIGTPTAGSINSNNNNNTLLHTKHRKPLRLSASTEENILNTSYSSNKNNNNGSNNYNGINSSSSSGSNGTIPNIFRSITALFQERLPFFISYSPIELARFLTIIENQTIKSIEDRDLVLASESEVIRNSNAKSLWSCVELFNKRSRWIQSALLDSNINILKRAKMIINLIHCAEECKLLGNFATVYQIISSLKQPCICLLKTAWSRVPEKEIHLFNELYNIIKAEDNYSAYRLELEKLIDQLYIPALPMLCKDLYTIGHNYPSYHPAYKHLINFHKFRRLYFEVTEFNRVKDMTYPLTRNPEMMNQYLLESQKYIYYIYYFIFI